MLPNMRTVIVLVILVAAVLVSSLSFLVYASIFTYRWVSGQVNVAGIRLVDIASHLYPLCTGVARASRSTVYYTDFESLPSNWFSSGGSWSITAANQGFKGSALQGIDDGRGLGEASHYCYPVDLSQYTSLWISVKTRWSSGGGWYGISLFNIDKNRFYTIEVYTGGTAEVWSWNVEEPYRPPQQDGWRRLSREGISNYNRSNWYVIVANYIVTSTSVNFYVQVYDTGGRQVASLSAQSRSGNRFKPAYICIEIDDVTALFDDFIISITNSKVIVFNNIPTTPTTGYKVSIYDNLGNLVNLTTATDNTVTLSVISDIVVGTGTDGKILIYYPNNMLCLIGAVPSSDAILGGDIYYVYWRDVYVDPINRDVQLYIGYGLNITIGPVFNISIYPGNTMYVYLELDTANSDIPGTLNLNISLFNALGTQSNKIRIIDGFVQRSNTLPTIMLYGLNNYVVIEGFFTQPQQTATIRLNIVACSSPTLAVCTITSVTMYLSMV